MNELVIVVVLASVSLFVGLLLVTIVNTIIARRKRAPSPDAKPNERR